MTISKCSSLLVITAILCTGCSSEESTEGRILSDAEQYDGTVHIKQGRITIAADVWTFVDITASNYTDGPVDHLHCNLFGFYRGVEVAEELNQRVWQERSGPDLESGESRAGTLGFINEPFSTRVDRVQWVCNYEDGNGGILFFEGGS